MMDNWTSVGARLPRQLTLEPNFPKPMEEMYFEGLTVGGITPSYNSPRESAELRDHGLWTQMIPLTEIIGPVNELHEATVQNLLTQSQIHERVELIANKLDSWLLRLPQSLRNTPDNLRRYASLGHGGTFVALHLGFHHHSQLLYYQFLHLGDANIMGQSSLVTNYAARCKEHAAELSDLLWIAKSTPGCQCSWAIIGHLLAVSSSIHLHSLLFDIEDSSLAKSKQMLAQNFELMMDLQQYWPSLDFSMSRLRAFHRACQQSDDTTFNLDHWMLQFLQRYMNPVSARDEMSVFGDNNGLSPMAWPSPVQDTNRDREDGFNQQLWFGGHDHSVGNRILQSFLA